MKRKKRGQARTSFWVKYISGELKIDTKELRQAKWVDIEEFKILLKQTEFTDFQIKSLVEEFSEIFRQNGD